MFYLCNRLNINTEIILLHMYLQYYHLVYSIQYDGYNVPAFLTSDAQLTQSLAVRTLLIRHVQ